MKARVLALAASLFFVAEPYAPSQTTQPGRPAAVALQATTLDPERRISQYAHTAWRVQDGVLPNNPLSLAQTADGYLWIGTVAGLVRFDGIQFVPWDEREDGHLPDLRIESLLAASDGSLWIGTAKGIARWKDGRLFVFSGLNGRANTLAEGPDGTVWIGRIDAEDERGGVCRVVGDALEFYGKEAGVPFRSVNRIAVAPDGSLWLASYQGLGRWTPGSPSSTFVESRLKIGGLLGAWTIAAEPNGDGWAGAELGGGLELLHSTGRDFERYSLPGVADEPGVSTLFVDRDDSLWIGTGRHGIFRLRGDDVDHFDSRDGLSSDAVAGLYQDREGTLWAVTSKGLDAFRNVRVATYSIREGLSADAVSTVFAARDGSVWVGNSGAVDVFRDGAFAAIRTGQGLPGRDITTLFEDSSGRMWLGIDEGLWVYAAGAFRQIDRGITFCITEDSEKTIWARVGTKLDRIVDFQVRERIDAPQLIAGFKMAADPVRGIWLGLPNGDLVRFRDGEIETYPTLQDSRAEVRSIEPEVDGSVTAATGDGLLRWKDGVSRVLTTRDGLPCDDLYAVTNDGSGTLWIYAKCGVVALSFAELDAWWTKPGTRVTARIFDAFDGAQPVWSRKQPQAAHSTDGKLWFAGDSLLQVIDPSRIRHYDVPPPVHIRRVVADRAIYSATERVDLPPRTRDIEIDYTAPSLAIPEKVRYRYRLDGHDGDWQEPGARREAFYNDLPPGTYTFRVIACNSDGVWNMDGAAVELTIAPAFTQTGWFVLLCVAAASCVVWASYRWRVRWISAQLDRRFEERLAERTRIAQDLHDTLLQGVLSASMQLQVANDQLPADAPAKPLVVRVLELMGYVVNEGRDAVRGLRSTDDNVQDLEQAFTAVAHEFSAVRESDFRVVVDGRHRALRPMLRDELYRIGREAVINAFRHAEATSIEVELVYADHELRISVRDDGRGIDPDVLHSGRQGHFGLSGMRERAERAGAKLKVRSRIMSGTEVELTLPGHLAYRARTLRERRRWFSRTRRHDDSE